METNSNFKKNKCWSCEFYCAQREYKKAVIFSDSVYHADGGTCGNKRSGSFNKNVQSNDWCSKYQKWGVLQSCLAREQARQAALAQQQARLVEEKSLEQEKNRERWQLESEKRAIEKERAELELARWYLTLTPEEQRKYDEEQAQKIEQDEIKRNQTENEKSTPMIEQDEISQKKIRNKKPLSPFMKGVLFFLIVLAALLGIGILGFIIVKIINLFLFI